MGNSCASGDLRISPGEDALTALSDPAEAGVAFQSPDNTIFLNESFMSFDSAGFDDECPEDYSKLVPGQEESPGCLNFRNLHASFLASFISDRNSSNIPRSLNLLDVLKSQQWSLYSQEYVAMCASFIFSILKIYGQCIPQEGQLINQRSFLMFHILDDLFELLSKMKRNNWHLNKSWIKESTCHDCEINKMVLKHVNKRNDYKGAKFCLVCLHFVSHSCCETELHFKLKAQFIEDIYPYSCVHCQMRFCKEREALLHSSAHHQDLAVTNDELTFKPLCCFLCCVPFDSLKGLDMHIKDSLEHACRKEIAIELAIRYSGVVSVSLSDSNHTADYETNTTSRDCTISKMAPQDDANLATENVIRSPQVSNAQYFCPPCSVFVPKANIVNHERGQKHRKACDDWASYSQKNADQLKGGDKINIINNVVMSAVKDESVLRKTERDDQESMPLDSRSNFCASSQLNTVEKLDDEDLKGANYVEQNESSDQEVSEAIEEYLLTERKNVQKFKGQYVCTKCFFGGNINSIFGHILGQHDIMSQWEANEKSLRLFEEKLKILSSLMSLCVKRQIYCVLKLIDMWTVEKLIDVVYLARVEKNVFIGADDSKAAAKVWQNNRLKNSDSGNFTSVRQHEFLSVPAHTSKSCYRTEDDISFGASSSKIQGKAKDFDKAICVGWPLPANGTVDGNTKKETAPEGKLIETSFHDMKKTYIIDEKKERSQAGYTSFHDMKKTYIIDEKKERSQAGYKFINCYSNNLLQELNDYFSLQKENNSGPSLFKDVISSGSKEGGSDNCLPLIEPKRSRNICHNLNEVQLDKETLSGISKPEDLRKYDCISASLPTESSFMTSEETIVNSEITCEGPEKLKVPSETAKLVEGDNNTVIDQDVLDAIEEYYYLDKLEKEEPEIYKCSMCICKCQLKTMLTHVLGKRHLKFIVKKQTVNVLECKLEILAFFELVKTETEVLNNVNFHVLKNAMDEIKKRIKSESSKASNLSTAKLNNVKGKLEFFSSALKLETATPKNVDNYVHPEVVGTDIKSDMINVAEASRNSIVVGDSVSASLQKQVQEICAGTDFSDIEMECGTCGVVFQIFNDDIDFSLDMHIQNDPQHTLATAVPVDRDAQSMSELSKTANTAALPNSTGSQPFKSKPQTEGKMRVTEAVMSLEKNFFSSKPGLFFCYLCYRLVKSESQMVHHLLSPTHLSEKWMSCQTDKEVQRKYQKLSSLLTHKYASVTLMAAMQRITFLRTKPDLTNQSEALSSKSSPSVPQPVKLPAAGDAKVCPSSPSKACPHCFKDISNLVKAGRKQHRRACKKNAAEERGAPKAPAAGTPSIKGGKVTGAQASKTFFSQASKIPKVLMFYCEVCKKNMMQDSKIAHLAGKAHKAKLDVGCLLSNP